MCFNLCMFQICNSVALQLVGYYIIITNLGQIIASENQPVQWTTPLGLPVVQPYRKVGRHLVSVIKIKKMSFTRFYHFN